MVRGGAGAGWVLVMPPPPPRPAALLRAGIIGAGATISGFAFFAIRRAAVVGAGTGSEDIDAREPRLGRTTGGASELVVGSA